MIGDKKMSYELPDYSTVDEKIVKARKEYKCCECGKKINKEQLHKRFKAVWRDTGWETYRWCLKCDHIRDLAFDKYPYMRTDEGPPFGYLYEYIREEILMRIGNLSSKKLSLYIKPSNKTGPRSIVMSKEEKKK